MSWKYFSKYFYTFLDGILRGNSGMDEKVEIVGERKTELKNAETVSHFKAIQ